MGCLAQVVLAGLLVAVVTAAPNRLSQYSPYADYSAADTHDTQTEVSYPDEDNHYTPAEADNDTEELPSLHASKRHAAPAEEPEVVLTEEHSLAAPTEDEADSAEEEHSFAAEVAPAVVHPSLHAQKRNAAPAEEPEVVPAEEHFFAAPTEEDEADSTEEEEQSFAAEVAPAVVHPSLHAQKRNAAPAEEHEVVPTEEEEEHSFAAEVTPPVEEHSFAAEVTPPVEEHSFGAEEPETPIFAFDSTHATEDAQVTEDEIHAPASSFHF